MGLGVVLISREIGTEVDVLCGVLVVPVDVGPGIVLVAPPRRRSTRCGGWQGQQRAPIGGKIVTVRDVPVVPVNVRPGVVPVSREVVAMCGVLSSELAGKSSSQLPGKIPRCVASLFSRTMMD